MSRLSRFTQALFGSSAGNNQIAEYGSLAVSTPTRYSGSTVTPADIQGSAAFASGWFSATLNDYAPCIEDLNALDYLAFFQICYLFQQGIPEWDASTNYYTGCYTIVGSDLYVSISDVNLGQAPASSLTKWRKINTNSSLINSINPASSATYSLSASVDYGSTFLVNSANGAMTFNLPAASAGFSFTVDDSGFDASTNNITIHRHGSESINGVAGDFIISVSGASLTFNTDGTNWFVTSSAVNNYSRSGPVYSPLLSTGSTVGWLFNISTSTTCAVGDTYTTNGHTYTVVTALSAQNGWVMWCTGVSSPITTGGTLTRATGAGTSSITFVSAQAIAQYTPTTSRSLLRYLEFEGVGPGGGGSGGGTSAVAGGQSTATAFGNGIVLLNGGSGGSASTSPVGGSGGSAVLNGVNGQNITGGNGNGGSFSATGPIGGSGGEVGYGGGGRMR